MDERKNQIPMAFWVVVVVAVAAAALSPRFFDMIWGRHH